MSNPATHVATASVTASSSHAGRLQCPVTARYPPTGAIARLIPSQRWGHQVKRLARLYVRIQASASGLSRKQSGLSSQAATRKTEAATMIETHAWASVSAPRGSSRLRVRGLAESNLRSAIRLNPIAAQRAAENATTTRATVRRVTVTAREAASTPRRANGSAHGVGGSFTKLK